jgi:hypothetical protein
MPVEMMREINVQAYRNYSKQERKKERKNGRKLKDGIVFLLVQEQNVLPRRNGCYRQTASILCTLVQAFAYLVAYPTYCLRCS